jgi:hypothetical protein
LGTFLRYSPNKLSFGNVPVGQTSKPLVVTLTNTSTATLTIGSIISHNDFSQTNDCGQQILAGNACSVSVTFTPTQKGNRTGDVTFNFGDLTSPQGVRLTGIGM